MFDTIVSGVIASNPYGCTAGRVVSDGRFRDARQMASPAVRQVAGAEAIERRPRSADDAGGEITISRTLPAE